MSPSLPSLPATLRAAACLRSVLRTAGVGATLVATLALGACDRGPADDGHDEGEILSVADEVRLSYANGLRALLASTEELEQALRDMEGQAELDAAAQEQIHALFRTARAQYKGMEYLVEFYSETAAGELNGPPLPEVWEDDANRFVHPPEGFQALEEQLFPETDPSAALELANEVMIIQSTLRRVRALTESAHFGDAQVWEAARQEVVRVASLGVSGFDSPVALNSIPEAAAAIDGIRRGLTHYVPAAGPARPAMEDLLETLRTVAARLADGPDFEAFDRVAFFREDVPAMLSAIRAARLELNIPETLGPKALRPETVNLFAAQAFDPSFFAPMTAPEATPADVALGEKLFHDPVLSGSGTRSCTTCHVPELAFTDGRARAQPLPGEPGDSPPVTRNTPTVLNAGLQAGTFYDLRTAFLEQQVVDVVHNRDEMHGSLAAASDRVRQDPSYAGLAARSAADREEDSSGRRPEALSPEHLSFALASYIRSLSGQNSRFDRYMRGEDAEVSESELRGFNLFMGKAACGTCHFAPLFNGTVPPAYYHAEVEVLGVPATADMDRAPLDPDRGRGPVFDIGIHDYAFKTTTVRNVALTAPYMHNGVYRTLEEVVQFYNIGGGAGLGIDLPNQTLPPDSLHLSPEEQSDLVAFMRALTDSTRVGPAPATAPRRAAMR